MRLSLAPAGSARRTRGWAGARMAMGTSAVPRACCVGKNAAAPRPSVRRHARGRTTSCVTRASMGGGGGYVVDPERQQQLLQQLRRARSLEQINQLLEGPDGDDAEGFLQLMSDLPRMMPRSARPQPLRQRASPAVRQPPGRPYGADANLYELQRQQQLRQALAAQARQQQVAAAVAAARQQRERQMQLAAEQEAQRQQALREALQHRARRHLPSYDSPALARLASSLAAAGCQDGPLCDELLTAAAQRASTQQQPADAGSLAELLDALHAMRHRPSPDSLAQLLRRRQQQQQPAPSLQPALPTNAADAARLLSAMSRLGYQPDEQWLRQVAELLQPQLQPPQQQQVEAVAEEEEEADEEAEEEEDGLDYSLQQEAQAAASAVRAMERMGRPDLARQMRERFQRRVYEVQQRQRAAAAQRQREAEEQRRREEEEAAAAQEREWGRLQQQQQQAAQAKAAAEAEAKAAAAARAAQEEAERRSAAAAAAAPAVPDLGTLRTALERRLSSASSWRQIQALLFNYYEVADTAAVMAAAGRLAELLGGGADGRGPAALGWQERAEVDDVLEGVARLALRRLEDASASQVASLLGSFCRLRYLEQRLLVALLRRAREVLGAFSEADLAGVLAGLAVCGLRPSAPWMEAFLERCEEALPTFAPQRLACLPLALARLGAHPGRSWLGSYLDELQARYDEVGAEQVAAAVRAVASLDRTFLAAWRQAAAVRQQLESAQRQQQGQQEQQDETLASVDEVLTPWEEPEEEEEEEALPAMHPRQLEQEQQRQQQQQGQAAAQPVAASAATAASAARAGAPLESVEVDVDSELPEEEGAATAVHLPGSNSQDGLYYSPEQEEEEEDILDDGAELDEQQQHWDGVQEEEEPVVVSGGDPRDGPAPDAPAGGPVAAVAAAAAAAAAAADASLLRGLRSMLMERTEAVEEAAAEQEARLAAIGEREVAAAVRFKAASDQLARLQADYDNFKRRTQQERTAARDQALASAIKPLLAIADNFERAAATIKPATDGERAIHQSYQALNGQVRQLLQEQGLEPVGAEGEAFDPMVHEAVMREERTDVEEGTVTGVFQKGYRIGDTLVRPAIVRVSYQG